MCEPVHSPIQISSSLQMLYFHFKEPTVKVKLFFDKLTSDLHSSVLIIIDETLNRTIVLPKKLFFTSKRLKMKTFRELIMNRIS